jgi:hypothetical protein
MKLRDIYQRFAIVGLFAGGTLLQTGGCGFDSSLFLGSSLSIILGNIATDFVTTSLGQWLNVAEGFAF